MKKIFVLLFIFAFLPISAQAIGIRSTMDTLMESWVGESINAVIDQWGYPDEVREVAGRKLYYWKAHKFYISGTQKQMYGSKENCNKIFETNSEDVVIKWQWKGTACPFTYFEAKKYVNPNNNFWEQPKIVNKRVI